MQTTTNTVFVTVGQRQSNFELLRIVAMFLVLVVHADFLSLGTPTIEQIQTQKLVSLSKAAIEALSIICVDVFVLISGWFGIKFKRKGLLGFLFQCLYFSLGIYLVLVLFGKEQLSLFGLFNCFWLDSNYWFVRAYLLLYLLAPILNCFIYKSGGGQQLCVFLIGFYLFQTIYGWPGYDSTFNSGYSAISFVGLYVLGAFLRMNIAGNKWLGGLMLTISVVINTLIFYFNVTHNIHLVNPYSYINPFVILGAVGLVIFFANVNIKTSRVINFISKSAFAVYLFHIQYYILSQFKSTVLCIVGVVPTIKGVALCLLLLIMVFAFSVIIDMPRRIIWSFVSKKIP